MFQILWGTHIFPFDKLLVISLRPAGTNKINFNEN